MPIVQAAQSNLTTPGTAQTTTAIATSGHNAIVFFAAYSAGNAGTATPSDSVGLTWVRPTGAPFSGSATGLTLDCWVAANITGSATHTFTLTTTGSDTSSMFVAEYTGRDRSSIPVDVTVTASDSVAASGAHITGSISPRSGSDDLIAFTVAGSLGQTFTAGGSWGIPPNGGISTSLGYDAFIQYINAAGSGPISNAYSVGITDRLDAFIVALKSVVLARSDEWFEDFSEVPEISPVHNSYQQQTLAILPFWVDVGADFDWSEDSGENDYWTLVEDQSGVVVLNNTAAATYVFYGEDAELYDEAIDHFVFTASRQQSDNLRFLTIEDGWTDWDAEETDNWASVDDNFLNSNFVPSTALFEDFQDWDEDPDDFFADDFGNDDADQLGDGWTDWDAEETDDWSTIDDNYLDINFVFAPLGVEDAWDWEQTDDEYLTQDDWIGADNNPVINVEDPSWWDEEPDQYDGTTTDLDRVTTDNNPDLANTQGDGWDHFPTEGDDWDLPDDYAIIDVVINSTVILEDAWFWPHQDDDDDDEWMRRDTEPVGPDNIPPVSMPTLDIWDHWPTDEDDWAVPDDYAVVDVVPPALLIVEDPWDWFVAEGEDEYFIDDYASLSLSIPEDGWDHFTQDADDEAFLMLDTDLVSVPRPAAIEDPWDWTQDVDDDEWISQLPGPVEGLPILNTQGDGWDHFVTDEDDWAISDDYPNINAVAVPASQFTDEAWDWAYEPAEDNEIDWAIAGNTLSPSIYVFDRRFEVFITARRFTVFWLPYGMRDD